MSKWGAPLHFFPTEVFRQPSFTRNEADFSDPIPAKVQFPIPPPFKEETQEFLEELTSGLRGPVWFIPKQPLLDPFEVERSAFLRMRDELLSDSNYRGKFVAFLKGSLIDYDNDEVELVKRIYQKHGYVPVYIEKVAGEKQVFRMRSPKVRRR